MVEIRINGTGIVVEQPVADYIHELEEGRANDAWFIVHYKTELKDLKVKLSSLTDQITENLAVRNRHFEEGI